MQSASLPIRSLKWGNLIFFTITTLLAVASPFYIYHHGLSQVALSLFIFYTLATGLSITAGYHRLYAHAAYKAHPVIQFLYLFFGAAAFEQSALKWSSQHRNHHLYVDTERDPYNIQQGFWHAHIGWLVFWKQPKNFENVKDLSSNPMINHQHQFYHLWAFGSGIILPVLIGFLFGDPVGVLLLAVGARLTLVYHATFCINSVCHKMGAATYDPDSSAKDHWFVALLTYGEGYHNFHHRFPSDYRNGIRWYHWDPSKWLITALSWFGLSYDLKRVPHFRILQARLSSDNKKASLLIEKKMGRHPLAAQMLEILSQRYAKLRAELSHFEKAAVEYQSLLQKAASRKSEELNTLRITALNQLKAKRELFLKSYQEWKLYRKLREKRRSSLDGFGVKEKTGKS